MAEQVILPKLGFSMEEATLVEWLVPDGGKVTVNEPLYVLESEKSTQEIEAPASGILRVIAWPSENYPVGKVLAVIE